MFYFRLLKDAFRRWWEDRPFRLGAALAYYAVFSLGPIVLLAVTLAGMIFDRQQAQQQILKQVETSAGKSVANAMRTTLEFTRQRNKETTLVSLAMLAFAAVGVFSQLQDVLNTVWGVKARASGAWIGIIRDRLMSLLMVFVIGLLLLVSLMISAALNGMSHLATQISGPVPVWQGVDWVVAFALVTGLFAAIFKFLPDVKVQWRDVWVGAFVTAFLFEVGKYLIGLYLARSTLISAYNAAGSLVVILLWVYYSSQIFLYGAELTYVYADRTGTPLRPKAHAEAMTEEARARQGMERRSTGGAANGPSAREPQTAG